jgi:hypothetical protein
MPGKTGKRAKPPTPCVDCGADLRGKVFYRDGKKDRCQECGEKRIKEKFGNL